ncbi:MAG TPA: glycosyltransferase family 1 protein [Dehalococcoidia bacterium]|nr:glycosyltransferase family 1 protein [Dehalococcoidia bacterium]
MTNGRIPERISRLDELATNLWWSWHDEARQLFRSLDYPLWRLSGHNPVKELREVSSDTLEKAASDLSFLNQYDSVMSAFDTDMTESDTWINRNCPEVLSGPAAYFSMEYAIHNSLPIYAGGLGILAGDICKEASQLGLPLVAVGFMYPEGYFHQHLCMNPNYCQEESYQQLTFAEAPIIRVSSPDGEPSVATVQLDDVTLSLGVWQVQVGRTDIYLLDTNLEENPPQYRELSARLYVADRELRLQQEILLGIGGVRVLRALDINPLVWHANEGHTAFMMLERVREEVAGGTPFTEALKRVQATTVFTTHTPVLAGHDVFSIPQIERYFVDYGKSLGISYETFLQFGYHESSGNQAFNMTALALRMAGQRCSVSRLHGKVTRKMWHGLWPEVSEEQVPIAHVTNGIHVPSWVAPELHYFFERHLGKDWVNRHDETQLWERLWDVPDEELWAARLQLKRKLVGSIRERMRRRWLEEDEVPWKQMMAMGALLDPETLTIAFVRRFTEYKRPTLIFRDIERLERIINNEFYPVQIIFAGKSHPADLPSKALLHQVYTMATTRQFRGRIVFVEDYDMHMARYLVQGVDVWLNTPRRLREACGTSGMKASLNGVIHLSVRDGWWHEGYNGANGWVIGDDYSPSSPEEEDRIDAEELYRLLEEKIVPLYYSRDRRGIPNDWISMVKEAISSVVPVYSASRMLKEYTKQMYRPAAQASRHQRLG